MDQSQSSGATNELGSGPSPDSSSTLAEIDNPKQFRPHLQPNVSFLNTPGSVYGPGITPQAPQAESALDPSPSQFEKLYLAPKQAVAGKLRLTFANPTPIALAGFLLCNTPACIDLLGWGGAGGGDGNTSAGVGTYYYLGAVLLYLGGIGEWILGNTLPATIFLTFGGYWGSFGATLTPFYHALNDYGDNPAAFFDSFAMFLVAVELLCVLYTVAAIRVNICFFTAFVFFDVSLPCQIAAYFYKARGLVGLSNTCRVTGAVFGFVASLIAWYLFFSLILEAVDFPLVLPVGDLSQRIKGRSQISKSEMV